MNYNTAFVRDIEVDCLVLDDVLWQVPQQPLPRRAVNDAHINDLVPDRLFDEGPSGLLAAADAKCWRRVRLLVEAGVEVNHRDHKGRTALWLTVWHHGPLDIVELLIGAGADVNKLNPQGIGALWHAIRHHPNRQVAECLWQAGAEGDVVSITGQTLLMAAAAAGDNHWIHRLLALGADPTQKDHEGLTAMDHAVLNGHPDIGGLAQHEGRDGVVVGGGDGVIPLPVTSRKREHTQPILVYVAPDLVH